jgi:formamidopyrimidine-DNA glycosylase
MPELPEVQTTVNGIDKNLRGLIIRDIWTDYGGVIHQHKSHIKNTKYFTKFKKEIIGHKIVGASRRAKNVLIHLSPSSKASTELSRMSSGQASNKTILVHMKMTGHLLYGKYVKRKAQNVKLNKKAPHPSRSTFYDEWFATESGPLQDPFNRFIRLVFSFTNGKSLVLSDMRRFAKVTLFNTKDLGTTPELSHLGPEPMEKSFTTKVLKERLLKKPDWKIKQALMDQGVVAGIGNIYSDEILWSSGIHPQKLVKKLSGKDFQSIWKFTKTILKKGIDFRGDSMSDYRNIDGRPGKFQNEHNAYRRTGKPCLKPKCKGTIARIKVGGRSAHFCPVHQK